MGDEIKIQSRKNAIWISTKRKNRHLPIVFYN